MKSIVLITTGQPSVNPRIIKEADALQKAGYSVTVIYCFWIAWADIADKKLFRHYSFNYRLIGGSPTEKKLTYFKTRLRFKINRYLNKYVGNKYTIAERAQARCYDELLIAAKKNKCKLVHRSQPG